MKPDPQEPADLLNLLRQQLILAQVRIMELEDVRDGLTPRLQELEQLLNQAQSLADQKLDEAAHLQKTLAESQQHGAGLEAAHRKSVEELAAARRALAAAEESAARRDELIKQLESRRKNLETEIGSLRSSRSWRWTAWLRALGGKSDAPNP